MPYGFIHDVPASPEIYGLIRAKLGDAPPPGLLAHIVMPRDGGLRYVDVWQTEAAWIDFRDTRVEPAVGEVLAGFGIPHDHSTVTTEEFEVVHAWIGQSAVR